MKPVESRSVSGARPDERARARKPAKPKPTARPAAKAPAKKARRAPAGPRTDVPADRTLAFGSRPDRRDERDHRYSSSGCDLPPSADHRADVVRVFDQRPEGACTGMAVCAAAEMLYKRATQKVVELSPRWAYRRAREADPWPGEQYDSSTTRAALEAWQKTGICEEQFWKFTPYTRTPPAPFDLVGWEGTPAPGADVNARSYRLLDYRRCDNFFDLKHSISRHGCVVAGARTHTGWELWDGQDTIAFGPGVHPAQDHAFLLVGYDEHEAIFHVLSSWGKGWGKDGFAKWTYADARQNLADMWAVRVPQ